jgi:hypothetical protein
MTTTLFNKRFVLVLILFFFLNGLSYAAPAGKSWKLSSSQRKYVNSYGYPQLFMLVFDRPRGRSAAKARRIESWIYVTRAKFAVFDNGYFFEEQPTGAALQDASEVPHTPLNPTQFAAAMTENDITRVYGKPDTIETALFGRHTYRVLRYLSKNRGAGILNVTFYDGTLAGVVAGFALQPADIKKLGRDLERGLP